MAAQSIDCAVGWGLGRGHESLSGCDVTNDEFEIDA